MSEVKVGGRKKSARSPGLRMHRVRDGPRWQFLTDLTSDIFAASSPTRADITSFERSD